VVLAAIERATTRYAIQVVSIAQRVPRGIAWLGFLKSPDIEAPANIPDVAGKRIPNRSRYIERLNENAERPLNDSFPRRGIKLLRRVCRLRPVNSMPRFSSRNGCRSTAEAGIEKMATNKTTVKTLLALAKMALPAMQREVHATRTRVCRA